MSKEGTLSLCPWAWCAKLFYKLPRASCQLCVGAQTTLFSISSAFLVRRIMQIVLISARNALLSRLILSGRASPEARARFSTLAFGRFADPSLLSEAQLVGAANALLADSGILDLEAQVGRGGRAMNMCISYTVYDLCKHQI
jgi:hypothetical protein